jgi:AraC-like DNA-binding protein
MITDNAHMDGWSTTDPRIPASDRVDQARHALRSNLALDFRVEGDPAPGHWGHGTFGSLGAIRSMVATAGPARSALYRTPKLIRRLDVDAYKVDLVLDGELVVDQDDRQAVLQPGDVAVCDLARPMCLGLPGAVTSNIMALIVPRSLMPAPVDDLSRMTAVRIRANDGAGALLSPLLRRLADHQHAFDAEEAARISTAILDLLVAALAGGLDPDRKVPPASRQVALVNRIYASIEESLADPALSPAQIAARHHISTRYLHKLFEAEGMTVADWVRRRRLERCRRDLADPACHHHSVGAIGARWGYVDASHFSRAFRTAYGISPREYRLQDLRIHADSHTADAPRA